MPKMNLEPKWLRATFTANLAADAVDRKNNILRGYVVAQEGPFKSAGRGEFDKAGLAELVRLGNAKDEGVKSRFTHPDMSSDGLGTFLGRCRALRMDKAIDARTKKTVNAVRANLHFDPTAMKPSPKSGGVSFGSYIMDLAESDPDAFSTSIVVVPEEKPQLNKDGTIATDEDGNPLPPLWWPVALHASDFVDTGDAVDSALSPEMVDGLPLAALWRGEELLDSVFAGQTREVVESRLMGYLGRYLDRKFGEKAPEEIAEEVAEVIATPALDERRLKLQEARVKMARLMRRGA